MVSKNRWIHFNYHMATKIVLRRMERKEIWYQSDGKVFPLFWICLLWRCYNEKFYFVTTITLFNIVNIPEVSPVHNMSKLISLLYEKLDYEYALQLFGVKYCLYVCIFVERITILSMKWEIMYFALASTPSVQKGAFYCEMKK